MSHLGTMKITFVPQSVIDPTPESSWTNMITFWELFHKNLNGLHRMSWYVIS